MIAFGLMGSGYNYERERQRIERDLRQQAELYSRYRGFDPALNTDTENANPRKEPNKQILLLL